MKNKKIGSSKMKTAKVKKVVKKALKPKVKVKKVVKKALKPRIVKPKAKVLVAMSGGVDSSVAAQLLKNEGYEVAGVFLHFWQDPAEKTRENSCCSLASFLDAQAVAKKIGIPLYTFNFAHIFKETVVDNFLNEYQKGRTPNPCVICNKQVKIGRLLKEAQALGFDYVATGHYARLKKKGKNIKLLKALDPKKDQSYFLYTFSPAELKKLLFPVGVYTKTEVRSLAKKFGLIVATKAESQDICFVSGSHNNFLKRYLSLKTGDIRLLGEKQKIGEHSGLAFYTIGQRKGLISGAGPYYVAKLDYKNNVLYVVKKGQEAGLYSQKLVVKKLSWLSGHIPKQSLKCQAVIRYGHQASKCLLSPYGKNTYSVEFSQAQRAISPGQSVVFYQGEEVLGGGIIK